MSSKASPLPPNAPGDEVPGPVGPEDLLGPDLDGLLRPEPQPSLRQRLDDTLQGLSSSPTRLLGAFLVVALLAAVGAYLLLRPGEPAEVAIPTVTPTSVPPGGEEEADAEPVVHVAGAVAHPGVYVVRKGGRLSDAVEMAGGLTPQADPARVNLAQLLVDGSRHYIPAVGEEMPVPAEGSTAQGEVEQGGAEQAVDLNTASASELEELPGVGPTTAEAIIDYRESVGPFRSVEELLEVRGIGDAKMAQLRDKVRV
ncbi:MAG: hypothetical protein JJLCMIEE_00623 [Acidimicrobiales bacterium]|nr:MAG: ComEA family DNA-binding protein [Actinomycetota bacterium]MBV6507574.1 hypothetical protein [Acidimicrobiales bacterium]RIK07511.1 MAG: competence protein ComEA [Acidobacteriota bacterium]